MRLLATLPILLTIGGMAMATFLAVFFVPFFFKVIEERVAKRKKDE